MEIVKGRPFLDKPCLVILKFYCSLFKTYPISKAGGPQFIREFGIFYATAEVDLNKRSGNTNHMALIRKLEYKP